jgi:3-hydroxyisobutyrate dehydrogenase
MNQHKQTAAVIGLGSMGLGMAQSLLKAGFAVKGFDINPAAFERLESAGGMRAETPANAAEGADFIVVVVVNAAQTSGVLFGGNGVVAAAKPGAVIISSATMAPEEARDFSARAVEAGLLYLDAPMSGGPAKAADGRLTIMASGSPEAFARGDEALEAMAETIHRLGDEAGIGAAFKVVNQLLAGVHIAAACEAMSFAARLGLDLDKVYEVIIGAAGNSWMFENRVPHILAGDYRPLSAVNIFTKDLGIVTDIGRKQQFPLPVSSIALQQFIATAAAGMGGDDDTSIIRMIAGVTGITLPKGT